MSAERKGDSELNPRQKAENALAEFGQAQGLTRPGFEVFQQATARFLDTFERQTVTNEPANRAEKSIDELIHDSAQEIAEQPWQGWDDLDIGKLN